MNEISDIFISYRREDGAEFSEGLKMALQTRGYRVFFDKHTMDIGENFPKKLAEAVKNCKEFIAVVTPSYCGKNSSGLVRIQEDKDWVHNEIQIALDNDSIRFFPILIDCLPPTKESLPSDICDFTDMHFTHYDRSYDTFEKILDKITPLFSEQTKEHAAVGIISEKLESVDVNDVSQFNVICKEISRFLDEDSGERAMVHILSKRDDNKYLYGDDYRFIVFYTLFSNLRRNHQTIKLIELVDTYGADFTGYAFMEYVYVEYHKTKYNLSTDIAEGNAHLEHALYHATRAVNRLPENNGILHSYALTIAQAMENEIQIDSEDIKLAFTFAEKIMQNDPNYALYYCTYGRLLSSVGKYKEALLYFKKAEALERPGHKDWILRISEYQKHELIARMKMMETK